MLSSLFVIEYAAIALSRDVEKFYDLKKTNQSKNYTLWSIGNWVAGLSISLANIGVIISSYFTEHKSPEIFKVILLTTYVLIISSMLIMKNSQNNTIQLDLNIKTKENNSIIEDIQVTKLASVHSI